MTFAHQLVEPAPLKQVTLDTGGRYYELGDGQKFASVTTVIDHSEYFDKGWLQKWIDRVGKKEADRVKRIALERGTSLHRIAEKYLKNDPDHKKKEFPPDIESFLKIRKYLDMHVGTIYGIELPLYSRRWQTAGTTDLVALWDRKKTIIDFKTAARKKDEKEIENYFIQLSVYALMFNEIYDDNIEDIIIVLVHEDSRYPQIFESKCKFFRPQIETIFGKTKCLENLLSPSF